MNLGGVAHVVALADDTSRIFDRVPALGPAIVARQLRVRFDQVEVAKMRGIHSRAKSASRQESEHRRFTCRHAKQTFA